jgi:hypothetical protein
MPTPTSLASYHEGTKVTKNCFCSTAHQSRSSPQNSLLTFRVLRELRAFVVRMASGLERGRGPLWPLCLCGESLYHERLGAWGESAHSRAWSDTLPFHSLHSSRKAASTGSSVSQGTRSAH